MKNNLALFTNRKLPTHLNIGYMQIKEIAKPHSHAEITPHGCLALSVCFLNHNTKIKDRYISVETSFVTGFVAVSDHSDGMKEPTDTFHDFCISN